MLAVHRLNEVGECRCCTLIGIASGECDDEDDVKDNDDEGARARVRVGWAWWWVCSSLTVFSDKKQRADQTAAPGTAGNWDASCPSQIR